MNPLYALNSARSEIYSEFCSGTELNASLNVIVMVLVFVTLKVQFLMCFDT